MQPTPPAPPRHAPTALSRVVLGIVAVHFALLLAALGNPRAVPDSAYHVAMSRQYAQHGAAWWDEVHYQPEGRPNLYGPLVHAGTGVLGLALGGEGDDFVLANGLLGILCWIAGLTTVFFFASRFGGPTAGVLAVAALSGAGFASAALYLNLPSSWMIVMTPWAIYAFLERRLALATVITSCACYAHLAGFLTAPVAVAVAAFSTRRLRDLLRVGAGVTLITAPYWLHVLRYLDWYQAERWSTAAVVDPLLVLLWLVGVGSALKHTKGRVFLLAWAGAPALWLFYDPGRFALHSTISGAVLGSIALTRWLAGSDGASARRALAAPAFVVVATILPLGIPSLAAEAAWLVKPYPNAVDWRELRELASVVARRGEGGDRPLVRSTVGYRTSALAIWADVRGLKGHWYDVRPNPDPVDTMSVALALQVLLIPPTDSVLTAWEGQGWLRVLGGTSSEAVLSLSTPPSLDRTEALFRDAWAEEGMWISEQCRTNRFGNPITAYFDPSELPARQAARRACATHMARLHLATMLYVLALEPVDPAHAAQLRRPSDGFFWLQAVVGDEAMAGIWSKARQATLRDVFGRIAEGARDGRALEPLIKSEMGLRLGAF